MNRIEDMGSDDQTSRLRTTVQILLLCEAVALLIALVTPITPSKTGSNHSLADWFIPDPTYLQEVLVYFLLTNGLLALLALVFVWAVRREGSADHQGPLAE